jgi:predicted metal-dependent phosphoesterase TrpH
VLKVELHAHTNLDPRDRLPHTTEQLIDRAQALGYSALAVTLHDRRFDPAPFAGYARRRGIVLLAGIERSFEGRHVLLVNFPAASEVVRTIDDVVALKTAAPQGLVIAPHPFFPGPTSLGSAMDRWAEVIDAVEVNAMFTRGLDFNRRARAWARAHGRPLVGNCDVHLLSQLGTTYSLVDAAPDPDAICEAIRRGRVEVRARPLSWWRAGRIIAEMAARDVAGRAGGERRERATAGSLRPIRGWTPSAR